MKNGLSKREREILEIVYEKGRAAATDVQSELSGKIGNSGVRTMLAHLEEKGMVSHDHDGKRYVYFPTQSATEAGRDALKNVVKTFFGNSAREAIAALIDDGAAKLTEDDVRRIADLIEKARQEGK